MTRQQLNDKTASRARLIEELVKLFVWQVELGVTLENK